MFDQFINKMMTRKIIDVKTDAHVSKAVTSSQKTIHMNTDMLSWNISPIILLWFECF